MGLDFLNLYAWEAVNCSNYSLLYLLGDWLIQKILLIFPHLPSGLVIKIDNINYVRAPSHGQSDSIHMQISHRANKVLLGHTSMLTLVH
jgi:hypothetical protein